VTETFLKMASFNEIRASLWELARDGSAESFHRHCLDALIEAFERGERLGAATPHDTDEDEPSDLPSPESGH
jgi:hypothetical protein